MKRKGQPAAKENNRFGKLIVGYWQPFVFLVICVFLMVCTSGCISAPPHKAVQKGPGPFPEKYEELILKYLNLRLLKPESLRGLIIQKPVKISIEETYAQAGLIEGQEVWQSLVEYDVKNKNGKYVGRDLHVAWIRHNRIVMYDYQEVELEYHIEENVEQVEKAVKENVVKMKKTIREVNEKMNGEVGPDENHQENE